MSESEANTDNSIPCPRCRSVVAWPSGLGPDEKASIAKMKRSGALEAVRWLYGQFGLGLADAKGLAFHITRIPGQCHRCKKPVSGAVSICPNCRSANLDW